MSESPNENLIKKRNTADWIDYAKRLGFGGMLGMFTAYLLCGKFPWLLPEGFTLNQVAYLGGALGITLHRFIDTAIIHTFFYPTINFLNYYKQLTELYIQFKQGMISEEKFAYFKEVLDHKYFIDEDVRKNKQLMK